jgi:hypothetical protein
MIVGASQNKSFIATWLSSSILALLHRYHYDNTPPKKQLVEAFFFHQT